MTRPARWSFTPSPCNSKAQAPQYTAGKRYGAILLLLPRARPGAAGRVGPGGKPGGKVPPASLGTGERMNLYSYTSLGVEVATLSCEQFCNLRKQLVPPPADQSGLHMVAGEPAYLRRRSGLRITRVVPGSPAEKAGLEVGDIIMTIGGARTDTPADLLTILRNCTPGSVMHMWLIGRNLRWKNSMPVPELLDEPAHVGHIVPRTLNPELVWKLKTHQARAIELLASRPVPIKEACDELEAICRILYTDYTPGSLRIPLRAEEGCTITATRYGWNIDVTLTEQGVETKGSLERWVWDKPYKKFSTANPGPDELPELIRKRLKEIDTTPPKPPSRWD